MTAQTPASSYLKVVAGLARGAAADGTIIPCSYQAHPRFSPDCDLCAGLHYLFIRFVSGRTYSKGYELRNAIVFFLDYTVEYERQNHRALHLTNLLQISSEVFYGYDLFVKRNGGPKGLATRLKGALTSIARDYDEGMPLLALPVLGKYEHKSNEPLTDECFAQLCTALRFHIDSLYDKLVFRGKVDSVEPYTFDSVCTDTKRIHTWVPEIARSLKTLIVNGHPFAVPYEVFAATSRKARTLNKVKHPVNIVELIYGRYNSPQVTGRVDAEKLIHLGELLERYYPSAEDQAAIAMFIQLQTGWNKETVMAIDGDNHTHILTGALNSDRVLITSEKEKSQSAGKPFSSPKTFLAPSDKLDKYSAYNLIRLARDLSSPLAQFPSECTSKEGAAGHNPLFLCMRSFRTMTASKPKQGTIAGRFTSVACKLPWEEGVKSFLRRYEVRENGRRQSSAKDLNGRLRPTWIRFVRDKKERPLSVVALQQGHGAVETTDVYYDSSGPAMRLRRERLKAELESVVSLLRQKKFKGLIGKRSDKSIDMSALRIFSLPGSEKSLWGCTDSFKPDWPGSEAQILPNTRCSEIPKCLFCSRVCVFEDSLPFLMQRQAIIQEQLDGYQESPFESPLSDELQIIEYIFNEWGDERALKEAARYLRKNPDLLPKDMQSLSILFED